MDAHRGHAGRNQNDGQSAEEKRMYPVCDKNERNRPDGLMKMSGMGSCRTDRKSVWLVAEMLMKAERRGLLGCSCKHCESAACSASARSENAARQIVAL